MLRLFVLIIMVLPTKTLAQGWGNVSAPKEEVFTWEKWWTEPLFNGFWMAWTRSTLAFFIFVFSAIAVMTAMEVRWPGGHERVGVLGLTTTRGDRLFISLLGSAYIFLAWIALVSTTLWAPLAIALAWMAFCYWRV